jgi:hypothetical protein
MYQYQNLANRAYLVNVGEVRKEFWCGVVSWRVVPHEILFLHMRIFLLFYNEFEQGIFVGFNVPISASLFPQLSAQTCNVRTDIQSNPRP